MLGAPAQAQRAAMPFERWVATFRPRAMARGVSEATYARVMGGLKPDTRVYALDRAQPEFQEETWQYVNRRASDWRVITGRERAREHAALLARIEQDYGVDRHVMLGLWGLESAFGDRRDQSPPHASGFSGARRPGLGRTAPASLLGERASQCAASSFSAAGRIPAR